MWPTPELENEILIAKLRRKKKKGVWECGTFFLPEPVMEDEDEVEDACPYFPLVLMTVDQKSGYVMHPILGAAGRGEDILRDLAEKITEEQNCPNRILVEDDRTFALLKEFCRQTGIQLRREETLEAYEEARDSLLGHLEDGDEPEDDEWLEDESDSADPEQIQELDQFLNTLMKMRDEELRTMPKDLVRLIYEMAQWGAVPEDLLKRIQRLFG